MMLKTLKILTIILAVFLIVMKTISVTVTGDSVLTLIPMYLIAGWLLSFLIFKNKAPEIFLSGWGILFGFAYFALIEKVPDLPPRPIFVDILFGVITLISAISLLLANYGIISSHDERIESSGQPENILKIIVFTIAGLLILAGIFSLGPMITKISYFVLGVFIVVLGFPIESRPKKSLTGLSVVFGFLFSDLTGLLRFFDPPAYVLIFAIIATTFSLSGVVLAINYFSFQFRLPQTRSQEFNSG